MQSKVKASSVWSWLFVLGLALGVIGVLVRLVGGSAAFWGSVGGGAGWFAALIAWSSLNEHRYKKENRARIAEGDWCFANNRWIVCQERAGMLVRISGFYADIEMAKKALERFRLRGFERLSLAVRCGAMEDDSEVYPEVLVHPDAD